MTLGKAPVSSVIVFYKQYLCVLLGLVEDYSAAGFFVKAAHRFYFDVSQLGKPIPQLGLVKYLSRLGNYQPLSGHTLKFGDGNDNAVKELFYTLARHYVRAAVADDRRADVRGVQSVGNASVQRSSDVFRYHSVSSFLRVVSNQLNIASMLSKWSALLALITPLRNSTSVMPLFLQ